MKFESNSGLNIENIDFLSFDFSHFLILVYFFLDPSLVFYTGLEKIMKIVNLVTTLCLSYFLNHLPEIRHIAFYNIPGLSVGFL